MKYQWIIVAMPTVISSYLFGFEQFNLENSYSKRFQKFAMTRDASKISASEKIFFESAVANYQLKLWH